MGKRLIGSVGLKPGTDTGFDLDEKGQIHGYTDTQFALPVGDDNQILSSLASEASGLKWVTASSSWVGTATSALSMEDYDITAIGETIFTAGTFTISSGSITSTKTLCDIRTEGGAGADDLDVNAGAGGKNFLIYSSNSADDVTIKNDTGTGNRHLNIGGADFTLDTHYDNAVYCNLYADARIIMLSSANIS